MQLVNDAGAGQSAVAPRPLGPLFRRGLRLIGLGLIGGGFDGRRPPRALLRCCALGRNPCRSGQGRHGVDDLGALREDVAPGEYTVKVEVEDIRPAYAAVTVIERALARYQQEREKLVAKLTAR